MSNVSVKSLKEVDGIRVASVMAAETLIGVGRVIRAGMSTDEILESLRHLAPSQVHSALAYYFDHQDEINADLEEAGNVEYWKSQVKAHPSRH